MMPSPTVAFLGGAIGGGELFVVLGAILILFGPKRLPELARQMGRMMHELQRASQDFKRQITAMDEPEARPERPALVSPKTAVSSSASDIPTFPAEAGGVGGLVESGGIVAKPSESHDNATEKRAG